MFTYEQIQSLNDLELAVYSYVIMHMEKCVHMKIRELADKVHVSTTTVLRFCTKMDCEGYAEFKLRLKMYLQEHDCVPPQEDLTYITKFIQEVQSSKYDELFEKIADVVMESEDVIFHGIGSSGAIAEYGARFFSNVGKYSQVITDPFYPAPNKDLSHSVLLCLSVSGEGKELLQKIPHYKEHRCKVITFTNSENCTIAKMGDIAVAYYMPFIKLNFEYNITTQVPILMMLEIIGRKIQKRILDPCK